jgi:hypothetical protein
MEALQGDNWPTRSTSRPGPPEAARSEIHDAPIAGRDPYPRRLGCHQRRKRDRSQQVGLYELRLLDGGFDPEYRLTRENGRTLAYRPDVAGETQVGQVREETIVDPLEHLELPQGCDLLGFEAQRKQIRQRRLQAGGHEEVALRGKVPEPELEAAADAAPALAVRRKHRELVQVGDEAKLILAQQQRIGRLHSRSRQPTTPLLPRGAWRTPCPREQVQCRRARCVLPRSSPCSLR